jgi:hypothetical protein
MVISLPRLKCLEDVYQESRYKVCPIPEKKESNIKKISRGEDGLTDMERRCMAFHKNGMTPRQIGEKFGFTSDRARKILSTARNALIRAEAKKGADLK